MALRPKTGLEIRLPGCPGRHRNTSLGPRYAGIGTTKRMPSAEATSPPPRPEPAPVDSAQPPVVGIGCRQGIVTEIVRLTQDSRSRRSAWLSLRVKGSRPVLQAPPKSTAHKLVTKLSARALRSDTWVKASGSRYERRFLTGFPANRHAVSSRPRLHAAAATILSSFSSAPRDSSVLP